VREKERNKRLSDSSHPLSYEGRTTEGIIICGQLLATEVKGLLEEYEQKEIKVVKVSFIGHSMGGLINRYA
jgi:hypothetical protein